MKVQAARGVVQFPERQEKMVHFSQKYLKDPLGLHRPQEWNQKGDQMAEDSIEES